MGLCPAILPHTCQNSSPGQEQWFRDTDEGAAEPGSQPQEQAPKLQSDAAGRGLRYAANTSKKVPQPAASIAHAMRIQRGLHSRQGRKARGMVHSARRPSCKAPFDHLCLLPLLLLVQCVFPQDGCGGEPDLCFGCRRHWAHLARLQRQLSRQLLLSLQAALCETSTWHARLQLPPLAAVQPADCSAGGTSTRKVMMLGCSASPAAAKGRRVGMLLQLFAIYAAGGFSNDRTKMPNLTPTELPPGPQAPLSCWGAPAPGA